MVSDEVEVRDGDQGGHAPSQRDGLEQDCGLAVWGGPWPVEAMADASIRVDGEAVKEKERSEAIAAEPLQAGTVVSFDGASCMGRETVQLGAEGLMSVAIVGLMVVVAIARWRYRQAQSLCGWRFIPSSSDQCASSIHPSS